MNRPRNLFLVGAILLFFSSVSKADIVTVLFTGFGSPVAGSGMEALNATLASRFEDTFPDLTYNGRAFQYSEREEALDFINGVDDIEQLYLVGHSFGGSSLIQLAANFLDPINQDVDLTFQIDSVDNFYGGPPDNALPSNVRAGFNYFQISTGFEPQGEMVVAGATNINVELLFNDNSITHTSIDNDPRVHNEIFEQMRLASVPEPGAVWLLSAGLLWRLCQRRKRPSVGLSY